MWECEWDHLKQTCSDVKAYVDSLQFVEPLNPRDAFCGGRTNAVKLYHHVTPGQHQHQGLLWFRQMSSVASTSIVPSRAAFLSCRQTHLSSLCRPRARRNGQTSLEEILPVRTLRRQTRNWSLVHPRIAKSRRVGVRNTVNY